MRLISNFRDFYDGAQGADRERTPIFNRMTVEEHVPWSNLRRLKELEPFVDRIYGHKMPWAAALSEEGVRTLHIAFCGKAYAFYSLADRLFTTPMELEAWVRASLETGDAKMAYDDPLGKSRKRLLHAFDGYAAGRGLSYTSAPLPSKKGWEQSGFESVADLPVELFRREGVPMLSLGSQIESSYEWHERYGQAPPGFVLVKNPRLEKLRMRRVWSVPWVWQEIDMFLSNQMATQFDPASARTDKLALHYHGFDEHSFKNVAPGSRKAKRRENRERKKTAQGGR